MITLHYTLHIAHIIHCISHESKCDLALYYTLHTPTKVVNTNIRIVQIYGWDVSSLCHVASSCVSCGSCAICHLGWVAQFGLSCMMMQCWSFVELLKTPKPSEIIFHKSPFILLSYSPSLLSWLGSLHFLAQVEPSSWAAAATRPPVTRQIWSERLLRNVARTNLRLTTFFLPRLPRMTHGPHGMFGFVAFNILLG